VPAWRGLPPPAVTRWLPVMKEDSLQLLIVDVHLEELHVGILLAELLVDGRDLLACSPHACRR